MKSKCPHTNYPAAAPLLYVLGLLLVGACAGTTWHYKLDMHYQYQAAEQRFHAAVNRYLAVDSEARLVEEYYPGVRKMFDQGVLGLEHRLDWIESLQHTGSRLGLPVLHYRIGIQTPWQSGSRAGSDHFRIYYSSMQLDAVLLHEGDLRAMLDDLDNRGPGLYSISYCRFSRMHREIRSDPAQGNIRAECELRWFNIRKQDGGIIELS